MTYHKPMDSKERREILELLKRGNLSHREISRRFNRSQSTISKLAKEEQITPTFKRKRAPGVSKVEETFSKEKRVATADKFLASLDELVSSGGLTPREAREVGQSLKVGLEARRAEDQLPGEAGAGAAPLGGTQHAEAYELVDCHPNGTPRHLGVYFGVLDWATAIEDGDKEAAEQSAERVMEFCIEAGLHPSKVDLEKMLKKINYDFGAEMAAQEKARERRRSPAKGAEAEFDGRGLA